MVLTSASDASSLVLFMSMWSGLLLLLLLVSILSIIFTMELALFSKNFCFFCSFTSWLLVCAGILLNISMFTRVGDSWSQFSGLRCLFSLIFSFSGVSFLPQTSLIALARLALILGSHILLLLISSANSYKMSSEWASDYGSVSLTTNITFLRGSSSSCCNSSYTSEGAKRLKESAS